MRKRIKACIEDNLYAIFFSDNAKEVRGTYQRPTARSSNCGQVLDTEGSCRGRILSGRNAIAEEGSSKGGQRRFEDQVRLLLEDFQDQVDPEFARGRSRGPFSV